MHFDRFAVRGFDDAEHFDVLLEGKSDVDVIDVFLPDDLVRFRERAEQRQTAVADVVAGRAIVEEADDLEAELAVLEHLVRDELAEIARPRDQHALQSDARLPSPLERFADELARGIGEDDVDQQVEGPDELRDLVDTEVLQASGT